MFCVKCGRPVEGDNTLCSNCAAAEQTNVMNEAAPAQPEWAPAGETTILFEEAPAQPVYPQTEETPVWAEPATDTFVLNDADAAPAKKAPKKKKLGLILGIAAAAVAAIVAGVVIFWDSIDAFVGRTFLEPEVYLANVEQAAITEYTAELTQSYGKLLTTYNEQKTAGKGQIALTLGDGVLSLVESALAQQNLDMDLSWLSEIKVSMNTNVKDDAMQMGMTLGLSKGNLLTADMIYDMANGMIYMAIPELNKDYLSVDISSEIPSADMENMLAMSTEMSDAVIKALPTEAELNELINTYVEIVLAGIQDVEKETETVTVGDASQKMVILSAKIDQEDLLDIAEKILKKAEKDKNIKKIIERLEDCAEEVAELTGSYYEPVDMYAQFVESIPYALESIEAAKENTDKGNYIKLDVYVDMQNNVRGHEVAVYSDGEKNDVTLSWLTAAKGDTTYTEANIASVKITGEETEVKGVSEGSYVLNVEGEKVGTLKFSNVTENSATLQLIPSEAIMSQILAESSIPAGLLGDNLALELVYNTQEATTSFAVNVLAGGNKLVGISLSGEAYDGGSISIPSNAVDAQNSAAVMQWFKGANFDGILNSMQSAGVPSELVDAARGYVNMLKSYMN